MTPDEFSTFYEFWSPQIRRYMGWKTRQFNDADDWTQDVFADLAARAPDLVLETADRYLWVAARNRAVNLRTRAFLRQTVEYDMVKHARLHATPAPDREAIGEIGVASALATLRPNERRVIQRTIVDDKPDKLVAKEMHLSYQRVGQIRTHALTVLRYGRNSA